MKKRTKKVFVILPLISLVAIMGSFMLIAEAASVYNENFESYTGASTLSSMGIYAYGGENTGGKDYMTGASLIDEGTNKMIRVTYRNYAGTGNGTGVPSSANNVFMQKGWTPISGLGVMEARIKFDTTAASNKFIFTFGPTNGQTIVEFADYGVYAYNDKTKSKLKQYIGSTNDFAVAQNTWYEVKFVMNTTTTAIDSYGGEKYDLYVNGVKLVSQSYLYDYANKDYTQNGTLNRLQFKMAESGASQSSNLYMDNFAVYSIDSTTTYKNALAATLLSETSDASATTDTFSNFANIRDARTKIALVSHSGVKDQLQNDIYRSTAKCLSSSMNLNLLDTSISGATDMKNSIAQAEYTGFLKAYTKYIVYKLRAIKLGPFDWHDKYITGSCPTEANIMTGLASGTTKSTKYNINGNPDTVRTVNWVLNGTADPSYGDDYGDFYTFIPLVASYWTTGTDTYMKKWFEIANNFECNQYGQVQSSTYTDSYGTLFKDGYYYCNWNSNQAQSSLNQGENIDNHIKSLATIAKSLTTNKPALWAEIFTTTLTDVPSQAQLDTIPFLEMTNIAVGLVNKYPTAMITRYKDASGVPANQRLCGLKGCELINRIFGEFNQTVNVTKPETNTGLINFTNQMFNLDGGMLEQSFNYNIGDANKISDLEYIYENETPKPLWYNGLISARDNFIACMYGFANQLGQLPSLASHTPTQSPRVWDSTAIKDAWIATANASVKEFLPASTPAYTSKAFPYSGYYAMRSGWDMLNDVYMGFVTSRRAYGHMSPNTNAIDLTAYGRKIIVSGGTPWYGTSFAPTSQLSEYDLYNAYFQEDSSYKNSTVLLNGNSQSTTPASGAKLMSAASTTIQSRWLTTSNFDFTEGLWDGGYNNGGTKDLSTTHKRQVIFVKDANSWIINDTMHTTSTNQMNYSQIWNFAPYDTGSYPGVGYSETQVNVDSANNRIYTNDTNYAPNIWMYSFAGKTLTYDKYYGYKGSKYIGWYSPGFAGERTPRADVHIKWSDPDISGGGTRYDKPLVTLIIPCKSTNEQILEKFDLSSTAPNGPTGFEIKKNIGWERISYLSSPTQQTLTLQAIAPFTGISVNANTLLVTKISGTSYHYKGIVLGCTSHILTFNGTQKATTYTDFEFDISSDGTSATFVPITIPQSF